MASRLRFTTQDDIFLLREVLAANPFEHSARWVIVQAKLQEGSEKNFSLRTIKEHVHHLMQLWKKGDRANLRKSGTEEQYGEKEQLLQEIVDMARDFLSVKSRTIDGSRKKGLEARDLALHNLQEMHNSGTTVHTPSPSTSSQAIEVSLEEVIETPVEAQVETPARLSATRKRKAGQMSKECLELLEKKQADEKEWRNAQMNLKKEKMEIHRRQLALEEQKFEVERKERLHRIEIEKNQQAMMERVINLLGTK